jgi:hypothetical protein
MVMATASRFSTRSLQLSNNEKSPAVKQREVSGCQIRAGFFKVGFRHSPKLEGMSQRFSKKVDQS